MIHESPTDLICDLLGMHAESEVGVCWHSQAMCPAYGMFVDPVLRALVIVFRGSANLHDLVTDLSCHETREGAHNGFMRSAETFDARVRAKVLVALHHTPREYSLILTGQSLGGAVATLLAALWSDETFWRERRGHVYSFNAPCSLTVQRSQTLRDTVTSVVMGPDVVSRLSYGALVNLVAVLRSLTSPEENGKLRCHTLAAQLVAFKNGEIEREVLEHAYSQIRQAMRAEVLVPGGRVLMMVNENHLHGWRPPTHPDLPASPLYSLGGAMVLELRGTVLDLGEIVISNRMVFDHLPINTLQAVCNE